MSLFENKTNCERVKTLRILGEGHKTWPPPSITEYRAVTELGSKLSLEIYSAHFFFHIFFSPAI